MIMYSNIAKLNRYPLQSSFTLQFWAIVSIYGFAFFAPFSIAIGQIFLGFMVVVSLIFIILHWDTLRTCPFLWITLTYIFYVAVRGALAALIEAPGTDISQWLAKIDAPSLAAAHWEETFRWLRAGPVVILIVGVTLVACGRWLYHSFGILIALLLGLGVLWFSEFNLDAFLAALHSGSRYKEGLNLFIDAFKLATIVFGLFAFLPLFLSRERFDWFSMLGILIWIGLLTFSLSGIIAFETRSVWIAGLSGLLTLGLCAICSSKSRISGHSRSIVITAFMGVMIIAVTVVSSWQPLMERWNQDEAGGTLIQAIHTSPWNWGEQLPENSVGIRAAYFSVALKLFAQRPIIGYGPADPRYLRKWFPDVPEMIQDRRSHYHNTHLEFLVCFGLIGYLIFVMSMLITMYESHQQIRNGGKNRLLGLFVISFLVSLFIFGFTTVNFERFKLSHFYGIILGTIWSGAMFYRLNLRNKM